MQTNEKNQIGFIKKNERFLYYVVLGSLIMLVAGFSFVYGAWASCHNAGGVLLNPIKASCALPYQIKEAPINNIGNITSGRVGIEINPNE